MEDMDNKIISRVKKEVFPLFGQSQLLQGEARLLILKEAKDILQRLAFGITEDCSIESNRLVFYNLTYVCLELEDKTSAKFYINNIKNIVEANEEYKNSNYGKYCDILNMYSECNNISKEERIEINENNLYYYTNSNQKERAIMAQSNIHLLREEYDDNVEILVGIHIMIRESLKDEYELMSVARSILEDLRKNSGWHYEEVLEILDNASYLHESVGF